MQASTLQISDTERLKTSYIDSLLSQHNALFMHQKGNEFSLYLREIDSLGQQNENTFEFVIVGQAINIFTLQTIYTEYFEKASVFAIYQHTLHQQFGRQAYIIQVPSEYADLITTHTLLEISQRFFVDCFLISEVSIHKPGLLVMDMDSTIIDMECIDEIAAIAGAGEKVAALTERAMQGELDFNQSLMARVNCLQNLPSNELLKLRGRLPINPGFAATIAYLQEHSWLCCIASGGFTYFADYLKETFDLHSALSNTLEIDNERLTGKVSGQIINGEKKRDFLKQTAQQHNIHPKQTVAIGDGANDLLMMSQAQLGVAYKAKLKVKQAADSNICYCGFEGLLYSLRY